MIGTVPMRIAHLSDLHLLDLEGAVPRRLFNKRVTGWVNLKLKRSHRHKPAPVLAAAVELKRMGVDHVVITGDLSNLALEREFDRVRELVDELGLDPAHVSIVPGNHDAYTRGAVRSGRFFSWFSAFVQSDLPDLAGPEGFPFVRL
jgi:3',5'-cyclic AMP phosphodiesterase CpdA